MNPAVFNFYFMGQSVFRGGHRERRAIANIELCAVPRTGNRMVVEMAIGEGSAVVRANVIQAIELTAHFHQHDDRIVHLQQLLARVRHIRSFHHPNKIGHIYHSPLTTHAYKYSRTRRKIVRPNTSRTLSIVIRSKICWKNPLTMRRVASFRVRPRHWA